MCCSILHYLQIDVTFLSSQTCHTYSFNCQVMFPFCEWNSKAWLILLHLVSRTILTSTREGKHSAPDKPRSFDCNTNIYRSGSLIDIDSREEHRVSGNSGNYHHFSSFRYYMEQSDVDKLDGMRDGIFAEVTTPFFSARFYLDTWPMGLAWLRWIMLPSSNISAGTFCNKFLMV